MSFELDPEVRPLVTAMLEARDGREGAPVGDIRSRRARSTRMMPLAEATDPAATDVETTDHAVRSGDATISVRWYRKAGWAPGAAAVFVHGGITRKGDDIQFHGTIANYVSRSGVPMLSVDYRVAPEHPRPVPAEDCYASLCWLAERSPELGVDPMRLALIGDGVGGGIATGVALMARDRGGPRVARQLLISPMLDDRTTIPDPALVPFAVWSYKDNRIAWQALLGDAVGADVVPDYAVPARMDVAGLPPTYIEVGELDILRDEAIAYGRRIARAGTSMELHVRLGCPHDFDKIAPHSGVAARARQDRRRVLHLL